MPKDNYSELKESVLTHIQSLFDEMEEDMATSHQEKYTLLEDAFENASDEDELRVAFEQWYAEYADELGLDYDVDELWEQAIGGEVNYDSYKEIVAATEGSVPSVKIIDGKIIALIDGKDFKKYNYVLIQSGWNTTHMAYLLHLYLKIL